MWQLRCERPFNSRVAPDEQRPRRTGRLSRGVGVLGGLALVWVAPCWLAACHRDQAPQKDERASQGRFEHVLNRGNGPEPDSLDPQKARTAEGQTILRDLFECLTSLDHDGRPAPGAAQSWSISPDRKTYTFALRPGARWSNGDPVTGGDFVAGLRRLVDPATASENAALVDVIRNAGEINRRVLPPDRLGVSAPNEATVVITLDHPATYLPSLLSHPSTCPVHRTMLGQGSHDISRPGALVSNGAFVLSAWVHGEHIVADRNSFYWNDGKTYWDRIVYLQIEDAGTEFLRYRAGEMHMTATIPRSQFDYIEQHLAPELHVTPTLNVYYYGFNLDRAPFAGNPKLRQALNLAIDRERIATRILRSGERPAYSWVPSGISGYAPQVPAFASSTYEERVRMAQQLLREAGYSAKHPLMFELRYNAGEVHSQIAIAVAAIWKQTLGAQVQLIGEDFRTLLTDMDSGQVQLFRSGWAADYNDALAFLQVLQSDSGLNSMHYRNKQFDEFLHAAAGQADPVKRMAALQDAERVTLVDAPFIPLYFAVSRHLVKPSIRGWYNNVMNVVYSKDLSLARDR